MSFEQALSFTLPEEGGYVDNPDDDGGATDHGITQHTYDFYRGAKGLPTQSVANITSAEVNDIYQTKYWVPGHCAELPAALGIVHFDWCVNHGVPGAIKTLQQVLGVTDDGIFGPATRAALEGKDTRQLVSAYDQTRAAWYAADVKLRPSQAKFYDGWIARDFKLNNWALGVADGNA